MVCRSKQLWILAALFFSCLVTTAAAEECSVPIVKLRQLMEEMSDLKTQMKNLNQTHKAEVENLQNQITALQNKPHSMYIKKLQHSKQ